MKMLIAAAAALSFAYAPVALAQPPGQTSLASPGTGSPAPGATSPAPPGTVTPAPKMLSGSQIISALKARGYTAIRTVSEYPYVEQLQAEKDKKPVVLVVNKVTGHIHTYPLP